MIRTVKWEGLKERSKKSEGGICCAVSGRGGLGEGDKSEETEKERRRRFWVKIGIGFESFLLRRGRKGLWSHRSLDQCEARLSLSREDAQVATVGCKKILDKFEITDVEVAF